MNNHVLKIRDGKINFCCKMHYCSHNCCGPFSGITESLDSIDYRPFDEIVLTLEDYETLYKHGYSDFMVESYSEETGKRYFKMALEADGTCKAFVDGHCLIHEFSPTLCKAFPFYFDMFSGLCAIRCEGFSDEDWMEMSECVPYFEAAKKMYAFWIDFYTKKEED